MSIFKRTCKIKNMSSIEDQSSIEDEGTLDTRGDESDLLKGQIFCPTIRCIQELGVLVVFISGEKLSMCIREYLT